MAKETFDRSKPHIKVSDIGKSGTAEIDFVEVAGGSPRLDSHTVNDGDDGMLDAIASFMIGGDDTLICHQTGAGVQFCVDTSSQSTWKWDNFAMPLLQTDTGAPLLVLLDLNDVNGNLPISSLDIGSTVPVSNGQTSIGIEVDHAVTGDLPGGVNPPPRDPYDGDATVVGFVQFNIPEPTSVMFMLAAGAALLKRRVFGR